MQAQTTAPSSGRGPVRVTPGVTALVLSWRQALRPLAVRELMLGEVNQLFPFSCFSGKWSDYLRK